MDAAAKEQLVERFRAYLEASDAQPEEHAQRAETRDTAEAESPDLFTLLAEQAALKNEVKLESRQIKAALDQFRELFDTLRQSNTRLGEELERQQQSARDQQRDAERGLLLELLELRDRLRAGHEQARRYRPGFLARRGGAGTFVAAMADGSAMNLARLDEILARRGVNPLPSVGRVFDPHTMHATEVVREADRGEGEVVDELRSGYLQHDRLLRPAEVIVNKRTEETKP
ncbi:nucleotide exchange factor GrpE [Halomonas ventosae]|uniref:Protein GrpE n=1 Tax=Halomonas ventosae TaxID=229007 RepID=A0A4R6H3S0_9GAMM|nr:nucleotide exchange factor GrpE [Halomonas ventosae]TDO02524.1 molecular chaperone GrpE [Halomonas ventosae]